MRVATTTLLILLALGGAGLAGYVIFDHLMQQGRSVDEPGPEGQGPPQGQVPADSADDGAAPGAGRPGPPPGNGGPGRFDPTAFFKERDVDGDGKLSGEEISERMRESLAEIDTDQDGSVSLEEWRERMRKRPEAGGGGRGGGKRPGRKRPPMA